MSESLRTTRSMNLHRLAARCVAASVLLLAGCSDGADPLGPSTAEPPPGQPPVDPPPPPPPPPVTAGGAGQSANSYSKGSVSAEGTVTETTDGLTVDGSLTLNVGGSPFTFVGAKMRVQYDANGNVSGMSGSAQIPSPHERVQFADPVEADIGLFSGKFLNENRNLNVLLKEDTDYFVYRVKLAFEMRIATGETGSDATFPLVVRAPLGGEILMIMDYTDPMYYVHGAQDLIGNAGIGWSHNGRIPFKPWLSVNGLGEFDGKNTRTGTFPVYKVLAVTGQMVDNKTTEVHLSLEDPFSSDLGQSYQAGYNGSVALDLFFKDFVGIDLPLGRASGGIFGAASIQSGIGAHAYVHGKTADFSWWPTFLPFKPAHELTAKAFIQSNGEFAVDMEGQYGWEIVGHTAALTGSFHLSPDSLGLTGGLIAGPYTLAATGAITARATTLEFKSPVDATTIVAQTVQEDVIAAVGDAQAAFDSLQQATGDYEIELSLRGLRTSLPTIVDNAKAEINRRIGAQLNAHRGKVYYGSLRTQLYSTRSRYFKELDKLKAAATQITDNDATRAAIEAALRKVASMKRFTMTYRYKVLGVTVKTVRVNERVLSDSQANQLIQAANNVKYIKETSNRKIRMQQIYDQVDGKALFERIRHRIKDGIVQAPSLSAFGLEFLHQETAFSVYAMLDGRRQSLGQVDPFDVPALALAAGKAAVNAILN